MSKLLFVYGTLRQGEPLSYVMENAEFLGVHMTPPKYKMIDLGRYPAVTPGGDTPIMGEVYKIEDDYLDTVDRIECYPDLYQRTKIQTPFGKAIMYWMPEMKDAVCVQRISSGDWLARAAEETVF